MAEAIETLSTSELNQVVEVINQRLLWSRLSIPLIVEEFQELARRITDEGYDLFLIAAAIFHYADDIMECARNAGATKIKEDTSYREVAHILEETGCFQEALRFIKSQGR